MHQAHPLSRGALALILALCLTHLAFPGLSASAATASISITSATISPSAVAPSTNATLTAGISSPSTMPSSIIDFEIFDAADHRVYQTYQIGVNLAADTQAQFTATWPVPVNQPAGTYRLRVGVFNQWWSYRFAWTDAGSPFQVTAQQPAGIPSSGPLALGVWIPGDLWNPSVVDSYATMVGTTPKIVMWYQDWQTDSGFHTGTMNAYLARGAMPMISWLPDGTSASPTFDRAVANGAYDGFLHQWAREAAAWGHPFYMRFAWEMNGYWQPYSPGVNGNTSADFVAMWRHVHDVFVQDGATNVRWVWSPNSEFAGSTPYSGAYPGDAYVDWIGVSGYNFGHYDQWHWWTSLHDILTQSYTDLTALSAKPLMLAETASTEIGGDKAAWITQALLTDIPTYFPRVRAVIWFDEDKENDWRVNSSPASLAAFQVVAASPLYQGQLP